jgi:hypothetical protein
MSVHSTHQEISDPTSGAALLPIFAIATVIAIIAICVVVAAPSVIAMIVALATVIGFAAGIAALLSHLIGPEAH